VALTYTRSKSATGITGTVESTSTLGAAWTPVDPLADTLLTENATHETRRATVPLTPTDTQKFLRLRVTTP
jgi:hypothetical protein